MNSLSSYKDQIARDGFAVIKDIYTPEEIESIIEAVSKADHTNPLFRKTVDLFAIRQFLKEVSQVSQIVFNKRLKQVIENLFGCNYFVIKSIYFDKPKQSNWFVAWHQDLTISVDKKIDLNGFGPWTCRLNQYSVQPPLNILEGNFTIRIHLDDTDGGNGALKVIPGSHLRGVQRADTIDWKMNEETTCVVKAGAVMIMRPLLMHSSGRSTTNKQRRILHIEFSNSDLPCAITWSEKFDLNN